MEYIPPENILPPSSARVSCCECGTVIKVNPSNMCVHCIRAQVDLTEEIPKLSTIFFCRSCERYLNPPGEWIACALESQELLAICVKRLRGLNRLKIIESSFSWTEPHSKRLKVKLTVQGEVLGGTTLQQTFIVEIVVQNQMCDSCHRAEAQDYWRALVQIRQRGKYSKTFYYLEQLMLKHESYSHTSVKHKHDGLDFFFATESLARRMVDLIQSLLPIRYQHSRKLISHDIHSNLYNYKYTFSIEIVPLVKDSLVCLSKKMTHTLGSISPVCLVQRITKAVFLIDACTGQVCEVLSTQYWRDPFNAICIPKQLIKYVVMEIDLIKEHERKIFPGQGTVSKKHVLADAWVVKESELGLDVPSVHTRTHLGHLLKPGDTVLGYNISDSNVNDDNLEKLDSSVIPDVYIVKKYYGEKADRRRARAWKLKHMHEDPASVNEDYNDFLEDLEEDPALRQNVNIYRDQNRIPVDIDELDPSIPRITLAEMLDDLVIEDEEMKEV